MTKKAGTILYNKETKMIALVYRIKQNDISFPKGHLEGNETLKECAIRETIEETGRNCNIEKELGIIYYETDKGEKVENHMYLAHDTGKFIGIRKDPEISIWTEVENVEKILSYDNLKEFFKKIKKDIK